MNGIIGLLVRVAEAGNIDAIWKEAAAFFATCGFSRANYGYTRFRHDQSIGNPDDALYLTTAGPDYARRYFAEGLYARTPVFKWAQENVGCCTWAWVREKAARGELTADEMDALRQNAEMGITAGVTVSFPQSSSRSKGALGLIADAGLSSEDVEEIWARCGAEIQAVAHMMHLKIIQLPAPNRRRNLTPRQREALEWVADGKTTGDIALLMEVSPAMVEKHLKLARETLDVETTAQAVAKAALLNMIFSKPG
ncbi:helix-turn-helix transcriptional regulator [Paragemmobacter straminiformis]|uniref:Autoinducer binding domain-containing protein n=1 Tax=Paragemmobacter straminiformis TaxID=2045119 RepID=A0A842I6S5_9RHOB|nr:LuxR family transcriptional regulator [Gemmobacter straminiformis]MBC2835540.1 autoinducer binding domain-containing protein [Gemmobacter straminiformis]